jgi:hypothetical protein
MMQLQKKRLVWARAMLCVAHPLSDVAFDQGVHPMLSQPRFCKFQRTGFAAAARWQVVCIQRQVGAMYPLS